MMEKDGSYMTEKILDLTLEIIYLLTGEDYKVVRKTSGEHFILNNHSNGVSRRENINNKKILEVTQKIIELLTREGWDHVEGHKDLYEDIKKENHETFTLSDGSSSKNPPERSPYPLYSQDSIQADYYIHHHYKVEDLVGIKVEIIEGEKKLHLRGERPCLMEDSPTFVSPDGHHNQEALGDPPMQLSNLKEEDEDTVQPPQGYNSVAPSLHLRLCGANTSPDPSSPDRTITRTRARSNDKVYPCSECGKCFTDTSNRIRHMKTHKGLKPFTCSECGKCFNRKSHLTGHQRVHTGEKPFSCCLCGKLFKHKSHLVIHNRTHTGEKPFTCPDCGKCFAQTANLLYHQKVHTGRNT